MKDCVQNHEYKTMMEIQLRFWSFRPSSMQLHLVLFMLEYKSMTHFSMVKLQPFAVHKASDVYCKAHLKCWVPKLDNARTLEVKIHFKNYKYEWNAIFEIQDTRASLSGTGAAFISCSQPLLQIITFQPQKIQGSLWNVEQNEGKQGWLKLT